MTTNVIAKLKKLDSFLLEIRLIVTGIFMQGSKSLVSISQDFDVFYKVLSPNHILDGESLSEVESGVILQFDATEDQEQAKAKLDLAIKLK